SGMTSRMSHRTPARPHPRNASAHSTSPCPKRASPPPTVIPDPRQRYRESCRIGLPAGINKMPDQVGHDEEEVTAQLFPPSFSKRVSPLHIVIPETRQPTPHRHSRNAPALSGILPNRPPRRDQQAA